MPGIRNNQVNQIINSSQQDSAILNAVEHSGMPMIISTLEGQVIFANPAACQLFGYDATSFLQVILDDLFSPYKTESPTKASHAPAPAARLGMEGRKKNGDSFPCEVFITKYTTENGLARSSYIILDHSEKKQDPAEEKNYAALLELLINNTSESFIMVDTAANVIMFNEVAAQVIGKINEKQVRIGESIFEFISPGRAPLVKDFLASAFEGKTEEIVARYHTGTDHEIILNVIYQPAKNANGDIVAVIITSTDDTDRKKAEEDLKQSEKHYRFLFENNPQPAWIYDLENFAFLQVNQAAISYYGYSEKEFLSMTIRDIRPGEELDILEEEIKRVKDSNNAMDRTWKHRKKNGEVIEVMIRSTGFDFEGHKARLVMISDVTEKINAEISLKKSNERYRLATRASFDAIWDANLVTDTINWGEGFETLFGYTPGNDDVPGSSWIENIHPGDKDRVLKRHYDILDNHPEQNLWSDEYRYIRADGSVAYVIDRGIIIRDENGKSTRVVGAMQDITELKQKEHEVMMINERFQLSTRATSDIIWDWDLQDGIIEWAENFKHILGHELPPSSKLPLSFCLDNFHPDDRSHVVQSLQDAMDDVSQDLWKCQFRYRRGDGSYATVMDKGYIIRDEQGKAIRMIGAMQDTSEQKYHEDLVALELKVFETSSTPGIPFSDVVTTLLKGIEEIHPEMKGSVLLLNDDHTVKNLAGPSLPKQYIKMIDGLPIGPQAGSCGTAMFRKMPVIVSDIQNDPLWEFYKQVAEQFGLRACWAVPILHSNGDVMGSFAIYYDHVRNPAKKEWTTILRVRNMIRLLLENNISLEQLKLFNERFDIVTKATHDLIWDWNLETNELYRDPSGLEKVYGFSSNEPIRHISLWLERIHPDDREKVQEGMVQIMNATTQNVFDLEYRFQRENGEYSHIYDRGYILRNAEGKAYRMIGAAQDITERKKLEDELFEQELSLQKEISQATISTQEKERAEIGKELHDNVNQVLTTTKLYLDLATTNADLRMELIKKSSKNIINAITEIRQLSRSLMLPSLGDLGLVDSIQDLVEDINATKKFLVKFNYDEFDELGLTEEQKLMMYRIVQEGLNNVIKHAAATETIIQVSKNKTQVKLVIKDNGKGFNAATVKKGAGLNSIRNRVYLSNGKLIIDSHPGQGSTLIIELPFNYNTQ